MKKIFLIFSLMVLSLFLFSGCAEVTFEVKTDSSGAISQTLVVTPDYELLDKNGYSKDTVNERVITIFNNIVKSQEDNFKAYNIFTLPLSQKTEILERVKHSYNIENDKIILNTSFSNYSDYIYYYCMVEEALTNTEKVTKNAFYYLSETRSKTIFSSLENSNMLSYIKQMFSYKKECPFNLKDLNYNYVYTTTDSKQRSNADEIVYNDGFYYHKWKINGNNLYKEIHFYKYTNIIAVNWYYLALLLSFVLFVILIIINEILQFTKQKQKKE